MCLKSSKNFWSNWENQTNNCYHEDQSTHISRPSKSHGFPVRLTVLTLISRSHGYWSLSYGKFKSIPRPKNCLFLKSRSDLLDSNAKVIDGLCEDPIAAQIKKKPDKSNKGKPRFFNKGGHRLQKQIFSILVIVIYHPL